MREPTSGQHAGEVRSRARGRAIEFADYRAYTPGDDPRLVDWRAYNRLGRLYLKQYEEERSRTVTLLVDASASMDWGEGEAHKGLYARRLAAAFAWIGVSHHERVRVFVLRDGDAALLPVAANRGAAAGLYKELEAVREGGGTTLASAIRRLGSAIGRSPALLFTDLLDPSWPDALKALAPAREAAVLQLLTPDELEPPLGEEVELVDSETGETRPTRLGPSELSAYRSRLDVFLSDVRSQCRKSGIIHAAINTSTPLQDVVLRQLTAAGILAG